MKFCGCLFFVICILLLPQPIFAEEEMLIDLTELENAMEELETSLDQNIPLKEWFDSFRNGDFSFDLVSLLDGFGALIFGEMRTFAYLLGQLLLLNGKLQRAMEVNQEAYTFDKYDEAICDNLALNYRLCGDLDSSWNLYKELTGKKLGVPVPYYNCGETLYAMGQKEEAIDMMQRALAYPFSKLAVVSRAEIEARIAAIEAELEK